MSKTMTFKQWQEYARNVRGRADQLSRSRTDQGFALAASVGIPRCACSLHNASIDTAMTGWCKDRPDRLPVARKANWMVSEWCWQPTRLADALIARAWKRITG